MFPLRYMLPCQDGIHRQTLPYNVVGSCFRNHRLRKTIQAACECGLYQRFVSIEVLCLDIGTLPLPSDKRFVEHFDWESGEWMKHDLLEPPYMATSEEKRLWRRDLCLKESEQQSILKKQRYAARITWMWCSKKLGVNKDVARMIGHMIGLRPYIFMPQPLLPPERPLSQMLFLTTALAGCVGLFLKSIL